MGKLVTAPAQRDRQRAGQAHDAAPARSGLTGQAHLLGLQRSAGNSAVTRLLGGAGPSGARLPVAAAPGEPLSPGARELLEARLGQDFGAVRVHQDPAAAQAAREAHATALTVGSAIYLASGAPAPDSGAGLGLLAHELAHVVQQRAGGPGQAVADSAAEQEASAAATAITAGRPYSVLARTGITLARQDAASPPPTAPPAPLTLPAEGVDMPWVGKTGSASELGYLRDPEYFWTRFAAAFGERLSPANRALIAAGRAPVVDATWVSYYPQHAGYLGDVLEHHHVGQGSRAVPLPEKLHDAYTVFHPQRRVVGTPSGGTRALPPQPTRQQTDAEIARHVAAGRIRGPGITPATPPAAPSVPVSSEVAAVQPAAPVTAGTAPVPPSAPHAAAGPMGQGTGGEAAQLAPVAPSGQAHVPGRTPAASVEPKPAVLPPSGAHVPHEPVHPTLHAPEIPHGAKSPKMRGGLLVAIGVAGVTYFWTGSGWDAVQSINPLANTVDALMSGNSSKVEVAGAVVKDLVGLTPPGAITFFIWDLTKPRGEFRYDQELYDRAIREGRNPFCAQCHGPGGALDPNSKWNQRNEQVRLNSMRWPDLAPADQDQLRKFLSAGAQP